MGIKIIIVNIKPSKLCARPPIFASTFSSALGVAKMQQQQQETAIDPHIIIPKEL